MPNSNSYRYIKAPEWQADVLERLIKKGADITIQFTNSKEFTNRPGDISALQQKTKPTHKSQITIRQ